MFFCALCQNRNISDKSPVNIFLCNLKRLMARIFQPFFLKHNLVDLFFLSLFSKFRSNTISDRLNQIIKINQKLSFKVEIIG